MQFGLRHVALLGALVCACGSSSASTYYVSSTMGSDTAAGTSPRTAWQSLAKLNQHTFLPGDTILLRAGDVWTGELAPAGSGSLQHPIQLSRYGKGTDPIIHGPATDQSAALLLKNVSYWEVDHLEVTNTQPVHGANVVRGIYVAGSEQTTLYHHIYIRSCYVHDVNSVEDKKPNFNKMSGGILYEINIQDALIEHCHVARVAVEGIRNSSPKTTSEFKIRDNVIEDVYGDGIVLHGSQKGSIIERNVVHNACQADAANYAGIWTFDSKRTLVQYNEVYGLTAGGPNDGEAFDADIDTDGDIFQYNYSHDNARGFMLFMAEAKNIIVRYNISQNDALAAARHGGHRLFFQDGSIGSLSNQIYNNTFVVGNLDTVFYQGHNIHFQNNIVYATGKVERFSTLPISDESTISHNILYTPIEGSFDDRAHLEQNLFQNPELSQPGTGALGLKFQNHGFSLTPKGYAPRKTSKTLTGGVTIPDNGGYDYYGHPLKPVSHGIGAVSVDK